MYEYDTYIGTVLEPYVEIGLELEVGSYQEYGWGSGRGYSCICNAKSQSIT